jgi:ankyrin repeat protein
MKFLLNFIINNNLSELQNSLNYENVNVKINKKPLFIYAIERGNIDIIKEFIKKCVNINITDTFDNNALFYAIQYNQLEIMELLLNNGINFNNKNIINWTPLCFAFCERNMDAICLLLRYYSNYNEYFELREHYKYEENYQSLLFLLDKKLDHLIVKNEVSYKRQADISSNIKRTRN